MSGAPRTLARAFSARRNESYRHCVKEDRKAAKPLCPDTITSSFDAALHQDENDTSTPTESTISRSSDEVIDAAYNDKEYEKQQERATNPSPQLSRNETEEKITTLKGHVRRISDEEGENKVDAELKQSDAGRIELKTKDAPSSSSEDDPAARRRRTRTNTSKRKEFHDLVFEPRMTALDRTNPKSAESPFLGFYSLFWLSLALLVVKTLAQNYHNTGHFLGSQLHATFTKDIFAVFWVDLLMVASSSFCLVLHKLVQNGLVDWDREGWIIQHVWQTVYLFGAIGVTWVRDWPWIQTVFLVLHALVMLMKQYSYSTHNGYLSSVLKHKRAQEAELRALREGTGARRGSADSGVEINTPAQQNENGNTSQEEQHEQELELLADIEGCEEELTGPVYGKIKYPANVTLPNFLDYLLVPSLVYEIEYPRTERIRWSYVLEKSAATFGCFFLMVMISEHYVLPAIPPADMPVQDKLANLPWVLLDIIFPFITLYLLTFYLIFECVLNVFAEISCMADRYFYSTWWNSVSWDEFARDWNKPVHNFLLRHVYHSSISNMKLSKKRATLLTFFLSSCIHELVMACITRKIRFYLLGFQMLQLPLITMSRSRWFREWKVAGNVFFWFGLFTGPSFLCLLYVLL
ncbi:Sterol O-acyltransferase 2 (Sterol-ester synthase 2) [Saitoella coloradoensis]